MRFSIIKLIAVKESRDLLRDRRTVLLILVLPVVLYPLFGLAGFAFARSTLGQSTAIGIVGIEYLPQKSDNWPALLAEGNSEFVESLTKNEVEISTPIVKVIADSEAEEQLASKQVDVLMYIPRDFQQGLLDAKAKPKIVLKNREADEKSKLSLRRTNGILKAWEAQLRKERFRRAQLPEDYDQPFSVEDPQKAKPIEKKTAEELRDTFVRMFPFILFVWVVAGAIQPAVDLTAGEKERGTMETLLISPAERSEIVLGKFVAVTAFGFTSVLWNVVWLSVAGALLGGFLGFPVIYVPGMLGCLVMGLPIAMLFSAVSLALGVFARSTKEGQYYLMPLMLFTMPLAMWSLMPGNELNMGTSLIPVAGAMLLQQKVLSVGEPIPWEFFPPVLGSMLAYVGIALYLAVWQFKRESVLFRETGPARSAPRDWRKWFGAK